MATAVFARMTMTVSMTSMPDTARPTGGSNWAASGRPTASPGPLGSPQGMKAGCGMVCLRAEAGSLSTRDQARLPAAAGAESGSLLTRRVKRMAEKIVAVCSTTGEASSATVDGDVARRAMSGSAY